MIENYNRALKVLGAFVEGYNTKQLIFGQSTLPLVGEAAKVLEESRSTPLELCVCKVPSEKEDVELVEIEISDDNFLILAKMAHDEDITLNQLINKILRKYLEKELGNA